MAKLSRNAFIEKHKQATVVGFDFADFRRPKPHRRSTTKRPAKTTKKPQYQRVRLHETSTGKVVPTPNQIIAALAKRILDSDYFIESGVAGTVQAVYIANDAEAKALADQFPHGPPKPGNGRPIKLAFRAVVDGERALRMARQLGLL